MSERNEIEVSGTKVYVWKCKDCDKQFTSMYKTQIDGWVVNHKAKHMIKNKEAEKNG